MEKRLILVNYTGRKGGGCLDAYESSVGFLENNFDVVAVVSSYAENLHQWKQLNLKQLIIVDTYHSNLEFLISSVRVFLLERNKLKKELEKYKFDYVYCPMITYWTGFINQLVKVPRYVVVHDPEPHLGEKKVISMYINDWIIKKMTDCIVVHSKKFISYLENKYKKRVLYLPLGRHNFYRTLPDKINSAVYSEDKWTILFFGRISEYKGIDILAEAYKKLKNEMENIELCIVGAGNAEKYIEMLKDTKDVTWINRWIKDEEVESFFLKKDKIISVLPYKEASQSGVALLTMDYGIPVIATKTGGIEEQIKDGKDGILVEPGNSDAIYKAILKLIEDPKFYKEISENELKNVEQLSWKNTIGMLDKDYMENFQ